MTPKSTTLSKLKQSELKRFDKKFSLGINEYSPFWSEDIKKHLLSAIEKAYSLGKEENRKKITKKQVLDWLFDHDINIYYQLLKNK